MMADSIRPSQLSTANTKQGGNHFFLMLDTHNLMSNYDYSSCYECSADVLNNRQQGTVMTLVASCQVGAADNCRTEWELQLFADQNKQKHTIFFSLLSCDKPTVHVEFSLCIGDRLSEEYSQDFHVGSAHRTVVCFERSEQIMCKGKYYFEEAVDDTSSLTSELKLLFEEQLHSDVTLTCGSECLSAHKAILAARSPVFKAMFEHECKESKSGNVDIVDVDHETLKEMLRFIYTGKQPGNMTEMAERLLPAADKYGLENLKIMCGQHMAVSLTVANVVGNLILSDTHSVRNLKTAAQKFIQQHKADVLNTTEWVDMFVSHALLAAETVKSMFLLESH